MRIFTSALYHRLEGSRNLTVLLCPARTLDVLHFPLFLPI